MNDHMLISGNRY